MSKRWERQSAAPGVLLEREKGIYLDWGATVPSNGTLGYAPFGLFFNTTSPAYATAWYVNTGTLASCTFLPLSLAGITPGGRIVTVITTRSVTAADNDKILLLSLLAGFTSTLPAATGTGNRYRFVVGIVNTSNSYVITTTGGDVFKGVINTCSTAEAPDLGQPWISTAGTTITLNATTTGGLTIGDWVEVVDIKTATWQVFGQTTSSGSEATPFS